MLTLSFLFCKLGGAPAASREHYDIYPSLRSKQQPIDQIMNHPPSAEGGLVRGNWRNVWLALIQDLWQIDQLSYNDMEYGYDEQDPNDTLQDTASVTMGARR